MCLRKVDTVARLGGDEFAILLDGVSSFDDAIYVAERIQEGLTHPFNLNGHEVFTTASIGIAFSTTGYLRPEDILRDADTAMYRAKEGGRARHEVFDRAMHARAVELLKLENDLRRAVERQEFVVFYQPIVALATRYIVGFEALVRWHHPERGLVAPFEFIPIAEETGLIIPLGALVLREACQQMRAWQEQFPRTEPLTISVNLSGKQFTQADLVERIKQVLRETGLPPASLKLEITESVVMENAERGAHMLTQLKALGVQLSIDDFGTGYSSLSYLHRFPIDILKIDRSFVSRMVVDRESAGIVETILALTEKLGKVAVAEGVETTEQWQQLCALQCQYGQGYLFHPPADRQTATALLEAATWTPAPPETVLLQDACEAIN